MTTSIDAQTMRRMNKSVVLQFIRRHPNTSRSKVSEQTGLNKATVSSLVDELIAENFVKEIGYGTSNGGRKPILLNYYADSGYCIGIDVQISHLNCALFNIDGELLESYRYGIKIRPEASEEDLLTELDSQIQVLMSKTKPTPHGIIGIGIAVPGMVDSSKGYVHYMPNIEIRDWNFGEVLFSKYNIPVYIENDANCGALSMFRKDKLENFAFVNMGVGIGVGIFANGTLYRGSTGIAGEFGHTTISAVGLQCSCGSYGCWEQYGSERALARYLKENGIDTFEFTDKFGYDFISLCLSMADKGDVNYRRSLETVGQYLGIGLANVINSLNPKHIYIGGNLARSQEYILPSIKRALSIYALSLSKEVSVEMVPLEEVVAGAAELVISSRLAAI